MLTEDAIKTVKEFDLCCNRKCFRCIDAIDIQRCRKRYWTLQKDQQTQWLLDKLSEASDSDSLRTIRFTIDGGFKVCAKFFKKLFHVDKNKLYDVHKAFKRGAIAPGYKKFRGATKCRMSAILWLEEYATYHSDRMPNTRQVLLAYRTRKLVVYKLYKNEMVKKFMPFLSKSSFYAMWASDFKHLKIKKVSTLCVLIKTSCL